MSPQNLEPPTEDQLKSSEIPKAVEFGQWLAHPPPGEEIVITGLSGVYPNSHNVYHFRDNLYDKVDMISEDDRRWMLNHPEIPPRSGKLYDIEKFDAGYFGVHNRQATSMDSMVRILMEKTTEAIFDAGINPTELAGTKTGVFIGACFSESEKTWFYDRIEKQSFAVTGCTRSMLANRLSYHLKLNSSSVVCDTACSSSLYALEHAYKSLRNGDCDMAIVGGTNVCLHPFVSLQFARLGVLSMDGACKVFDENGNGYARSEAIVVIFLQKSKDARRLYSQLIHAKTNCDGYKEQGITFPSSETQKALLNEFYQECKIDPTTLSYLEAHGTGTKVGDPEEVLAIDEIFCKDRKTPLLVGAVKSNIGHSEPSSGLCSITKVIIGMENNLIPPNINYASPRIGLDALEKGRLKVVTDKIPFEDDRGLVGINSFGFGGGNCHVLMQWNPKQKSNNGLPKDNLPRLICVSGRISESITYILDDIKNRQLDAEYIRLYHQIFSIDANGHLYRGFSIVSKTGEIIRSNKCYGSDKKPLYLAFSSFGKTWRNIANHLLDLPMFSASIQRVHDILVKVNIDIMSIILNTKDTTTFNQILGTMAVQIGLVDIIKRLNIEPKGIFGIGVGEFICSYFDGSLSLEQTVLAIHQIALIFDKLEPNYSFIVGLGEDKIKPILPKDIHISRTISKNTSIISGKSFGIVIDNLVNKGIFVKEIDYGISFFQTKEFSNIKSQLKEKLTKIIPKPKPKNTKWLSTSKDNLASPDFFLKALKKMTNKILEQLRKNDVVLEIGDGHLLATESNIENNLNYLYFKDTKHNNNFVMLLEILGSLYESGYSMKVDQLYPDIVYPVSRGTPMISPLIKWHHNQDWFVTSYKSDNYSLSSSERIIGIGLKDSLWQYIKGHVIDGRNLFPATGYLTLAWDALAGGRGMIRTDLQVILENCRFHRATTISADETNEFQISIQRSSGNFEIIESTAVVVSGTIYTPSTFTENELNLPIIEDILVTGEDLLLQTKDIYKELRLRGYNYSGQFRQIKQCNSNVTKAMIRWDGNFITFMDNMLQLKILQTDTRLLYVPTAIRRLSIDAKLHIGYAKSFDEDEPYLPVYVYKDLDIVKCGGIEIRGIQASSIARRKPRSEPVLEKYLFIPNEIQTTLKESIRVNMQLALENAPAIKVKSVELLDEESGENSTPLSPLIHQVLSDLPLIQTSITILSKKPLDYPQFTVENKTLATETDCNFVVGTKIMQRAIICSQAFGALKENGFIITREQLNSEINPSDYPEIDILTTHVLENEKILLIRKSKNYKRSTIIKITNSNFNWLPVLQDAVKNDVDVIAYSQNEILSGVLGLVNCIRREPGGNNIKCVFIMDEAAPTFDLNNSLYSSQLKKNFAINIYKDQKWGSYRHLLLPEVKEVQREHCYVNVTVRGDLSSLRWIEGPLTSKSVLHPEQTLISVYYAALNFRDIMTASGRINADVITMDRTIQDCVQGFEFSGRTITGKRCMGVLTAGALSTLVAADSYLIWEIPDIWTLEEAATIPVVYNTVLYSFFVEHTLKRDETLLIHSGTGGVGQAAIHVALHHGCTVYTTVGTKEKREFLKRRFPQLTDKHIGNSRDTSFEQMIYDRTGGRGVDIVLNSLAEDKLQASVRCLAKGGKFFEIGKFDLANNSPLRLLFMQKEASFHGIVVDLYFSQDPAHKMQFSKLLQTGMDRGYIKPIDRTVFKDDEIEQAFRYMTSGKHMGKVLIEIRKEEPEKTIAPSFRLKSGVPRYCCNDNNSYVIIGGLGGFGLELADWLILRGARKLILTSRKGLSTGYQVYRRNIWKSYGAFVHISTANVTTRKGCEDLMEEANQLGPVAAIFNLAVVLKDALFENQNVDNFVTSLEPKAYATMHLDQVTRELCPELKDFVVFSSVSCGRGNAGQTNYGMSNSIMERICEKRRNEGLPGLAIEWGAIGEVGLVADMQEENTEIEIGGTLQQRITNCLSVLDVLLAETNPIVGSMVVAEKRGGSGGADNIVDAVANILGIRDVKTVSFHSTLAELGMDSMTGVEIKQTLEREFEVFLTAQDIRSMTFARLLEIQDENQVEEHSNLVKKEKKLEGLEGMLRIVSDESTSKLPVIVQKTQIKEDNLTAPKVVFLPGIEGVASVLDPLTENLHVHGITIQFLLEIGSTIPELAAYVLPYVEENLSKTKPFNLVAYSYGALVALELVGLLETKGYSGHLICIDGSPKLFAELIKKQLDLSSDAKFQTSLLCHCMTVYLPLEIVFSNKDRLLHCGSLEERMQVVEGIIPKDLPHPIGYYKNLTIGLYERLKSVVEYRPVFNKLKSKISLYKPQQPMLTDFTEDYNLTELCENSLDIKIFKGNHVTILENLKVAETIDQTFTENEVFSKETTLIDVENFGEINTIKQI